MKQLLLILLGLFVFTSCFKDEDDVPGYQPGRLTKVSHEAYSLGQVYHKYEYSGETITDLYSYSPPKTFISKYKLENEQLKEIYYSFENTSAEYFNTESVIYFYTDTLVVEKNYTENESYEELLTLKNGKIISSVWSTNGVTNFINFYYEWSGDNLIGMVNEFWYGLPLTANTTEYIYEYSDIENPFYFSNIPLLMKEFDNPYNNFDELTDLIPKCSRNFPSKLTVIYDGSLWDGPTVFYKYIFECKTFPDANKPYEIKMITTYEAGLDLDRQVDYFLTYEDL